MSDVRLINGGGLLVCEWIKDLGEVVGTVSGHAGHVSETSKVRAIFAVHRSAQGQLYRDLFSIHPCFMAYQPTVWSCFRIGFDRLQKSFSICYLLLLNGRKFYKILVWIS